jgi:copper resistance protein B
MRKAFIGILSTLVQLVVLASSRADAYQVAELSPANLIVADAWPSPVDDSGIYNLVLLDRLEYESGEKGSLNWGITGWSGSDLNRLWLKSEGTYAFLASNASATDFQMLYGRLISSFFDAQVGIREEQGWGKNRRVSRISAVFGLEGISFYFFQLEAGLFVAQSGQVAARVTTSKDILLTQKMIAQLRLEANGSTERSYAFETGSGLNDLSLGFRLRYEIIREFAPYLGVSWTQRFGETADFSRRDGGKVSDFAVIAGLRLWH